MKVYRIALVLFLLLPFTWNGIVDAENSHQRTLSQIVFLVH